MFNLLKENISPNFRTKVLENLQRKLGQEQLVELGAVLNRVAGEELESVERSVSELERTKFVDPVLGIPLLHAVAVPDQSVEQGLQAVSVLNFSARGISDQG